MINELHKKGNQLLILSLLIISILICIISIIINYYALKGVISNEVSNAHSPIQDGEFLKIAHPIKIADFEDLPNKPTDPNNGFFIVTVKNHEYLIYKNNISHRFGMTHYPECPCLNKRK